MNKLHVYYDYDSDWVIAESTEQASKIWREVMYIDQNDIPDDEINFIQEDDDKELSIYYEDIPEDLTDKEKKEIYVAGNNWWRLTKTCGEWAEEYKKGFLCSTEY